MKDTLSKRLHETSSTDTSPRTLRTYVWIIIAVAAAARLLYVGDIKNLPFFNAPVGDEAAYHAVAHTILGGDLLAGTGIFYQDPLYPYFLAAVYALFGDSVIVPKAIQLAVGILSCILIFFIARRLFGTGTAFVAGIVAAVYPLFYFFEAQLLKSSLVVFFTLALFWLLLRYRDSASPRAILSAGLCAGLAVASQGHSYFYLPFIVLWIVMLPTQKGLVTRVKAAVRPLLLFFAGVAVIILPITLRNYAVGKDLVLVTYQGGTNFYMGNNERATGIYQPIREGRELPPYEEMDAVAVAQEQAGRKLRPSEVSRHWFARARSFIVSNPARYAMLLGKKIFLFCNKLEISDVVDYYFVSEKSFLPRLPLLNFGLLIPLAVVGILLAWRRKDAGVLLLYYFSFASFFSLVMFYIFSRYRLQGVPFYIILASYGIVEGRALVRAGPSPRLWILIAVFAGTFLFANQKNTVISQGLGNGLMGAMCMEKGDFTGAAKYLTEALRKNPGDPVVQRNLLTQLAQSLFQLRDYDGAINAYDRAITIEDRRGDKADLKALYAARSGLGAALRMRGDFARARELFEQLLRENPEDLVVRTNLSTVYKKLGRHEDAFTQLAYVVERDTMNLVALNNIANMYRDAGQYEDAERFYRQCLVIDPQNSVVLKNRQKLRQRMSGATTSSVGDGTY